MHSSSKLRPRSTSFNPTPNILQKPSSSPSGLLPSLAHSAAGAPCGGGSALAWCRRRFGCAEVALTLGYSPFSTTEAMQTHALPSFHRITGFTGPVSHETAGPAAGGRPFPSRGSSILSAVHPAAESVMGRANSASSNLDREGKHSCGSLGNALGQVCIYGPIRTARPAVRSALAAAATDI